MSYTNIGFGNMVNSEKIIAVIQPDSAPAKRLIQKARERDLLYDATQGRRTHGVIITERDQIILSALVPETICSRMDEKGENDHEEA